MFAALGRFVTRFRWFIIAAWIVLAGVVATLAPALQSTQDNSEFLPDHYESIKAAKLQSDSFSDAFSPGAILVIERKDGKKLTAADQGEVGTLAQELAPKLGKKTFQQAVVAQGEDDEGVYLTIAYVDVEPWTIGRCRSVPADEVRVDPGRAAELAGYLREVVA